MTGGSLQPRFGAHQGEEKPERFDATTVFLVDPFVVDRAIAVRNTVAEPHRATQNHGKLAIHCTVFGQQIKAPSSVVGDIPAGIGDPVGSEVYGFLDGQEEIE